MNENDMDKVLRKKLGQSVKKKTMGWKWQKPPKSKDGNGYLCFKFTSQLCKLSNLTKHNFQLKQLTFECFNLTPVISKALSM